jgi:hypothetical protein
VREGGKNYHHRNTLKMYHNHHKIVILINYKCLKLANSSIYHCHHNQNYVRSYSMLKFIYKILVGKTTWKS